MEDGKTVVVSDTNKVYWLNNGKKLAEFNAKEQVTAAATLLPNNTVIVASGFFGFTKRFLWLKNGSKLAEFNVEP